MAPRPPLASLATFRRDAYGLFARTMAYPAADLVSTIPTMHTQVSSAGRPFEHLTISAPVRRALDALGELSEETLPKLRQDHAMLFSCGLGSCHALESAHLSRGGWDAGWLAVRLLAEYRSAGFDPVPGGESPDHLTVELAFMSALCGQEARAWQAAHTAESDQWLRAQQEFLDRHLLWWLPTFVAQTNRADGFGFYGGLAGSVLLFAGHDRELTASLRPLTPAAVSRGGP